MLFKQSSPIRLFFVAKIELTLASKVNYLNLPQPMYKNINEEEEKAQVNHLKIDC